MQIESMIGGVKANMTPLISFNAIIDSDFGLIDLIYREYFDTNIFKKEFFEKDPRDIISELYNRKDRNPLYLISQDDVSKKLLDDYYNQFINEKIEDIYKLSISTEILNLIDSFNKSGEINTEILYTSQEQLKLLKNEPKLQNNKKVQLNNLNKNKYQQFFFKDIEEAIPFLDLSFKSFYFSSCRINAGDKNEKELSDINISRKLLKNNNKIGIFDIYKNDIIQRSINND